MFGGKRRAANWRKTPTFQEDALQETLRQGYYRYDGFDIIGIQKSREESVTCEPLLRRNSEAGRPMQSVVTLNNPFSPEQ